MNTVIADNLRALRQGLNLSLSEVSERTGVSKSMLGQIERNESSPTISTLWKIATGLQVSFTSLMERPEQGIRIVRESEVTPVINDHGRFRLYPVCPRRPTAALSWSISSLSRALCPSPAPTRTARRRSCSSIRASWRSSSGKRPTSAMPSPAGSVISYRADQPHIYRNLADGVTRAAMVINYAPPKKAP